jgi:hypothetical protein
MLTHLSDKAIFPSQVLFACVYGKKLIFSLPRSLVPKLVLPTLGQGKFVRVYGRQGKLDKCTRNTSMIFGKQKAAREINV